MALVGQGRSVTGSTERERRAISDDLASARPDSSVLPEEISGYGSSAHWP
jgi:hypothetical protein